MGEFPVQESYQAVEVYIVQAYYVILPAQSLFAGGVASRLQQYLHQTGLEIVDPRQPDAMAQIIAIQL